MIRLDIPLGDMNFTYIVNGAEQKAWANEGSGWTDLSSTYQDQYDVWQPTYQGYVGNQRIKDTWTNLQAGLQATTHTLQAMPQLQSVA